MINQRSLDIVRQRKFQNFRRPSYEQYNFLNLIRDIPHLFSGRLRALPEDTISLDGEPVNKVLFFLLDAFGWRFLEQYLASHPVLRDFEKNGTLSMLTSLFPSTTAAHISFMNTGIPPWESGIFEWNCYIPKLERIICPLTWALPKEKKGSLTDRLGCTPAEILPPSQLYPQLDSLGIPSVTFVPNDYVDTPFNRQVNTGATRVGYEGLLDGFHKIRQCIENHEKVYASIYSDVLDITLHRKGPEHPAFSQTIEDVLNALSEFVIEPLRATRQRTLLILSADHGGVALPPESCTYLDDEDQNLLSLMRTDSVGKPLVPCGSNRDLFLHVKPGHIEEVRGRISKILEGKASILSVVEANEERVLAPDSITSEYHRSLGDLIILPYAGHQVFWSLKGKYRKTDKGSHGGLTQEEMEIPCLSMVIGA